MSSVDPLAVPAALIGAMPDAAAADASLDLGAVAQVLQAQLAAGDILEATVLAPKGGQDLISILGQTVVAQLPPDVRPGEQLLLQVTGFQGNQILVRNLGVQDPQNPVLTVALDLPAQAQPGTASTATLTTIAPPQSPAPATQAQATTQPQPQATAQAATQGPPQSAVPQPQAPPVAPPREVFVAASVVRPGTVPIPPAQTPPAQSPATAPSNPAPKVDIEARLAAARAATAEHVVPKDAAPAQQVRSAPVGADARAPQSPVRTQAFAQTVFSRPPAAAGAPPRPAASTPAAQAPALSTRPQLEAAVAAREPVRLLAALRIPATPVTLAAARAVSGAAQQVSAALQNLERVLAQPSPADARLSTLQTLTSFVAHLDPRNEQTFPAQLSAFASNVLDGAESKLAQLLSALSARGTRGTHAPAAVPHDEGAPHQAPAPASSPRPDAPVLPALERAPVLAQARAAERQMALSHDLKSTLLSLVANPPNGTSAQLSQALHDTLTALTAMQFNTLIANQTDPANVTLTIPVMFYDGGQAANIRVSRDAPDKREPLDADNFHIAFVLDTASLGTLAIDLETVGRSVKVAVRTDRASAVDRIKTSLPDLTARLEHLRYRVTSAGADAIAAPQPSAETAPASPPPPLLEKPANLDLQA